MQFSVIEKEVIFLKAVQELIDDMVNYEVVMLVGNDPDSEIRFNSMTHKRFFNIILVDFLSCSARRILGEESPYLTALHQICASPNFNQSNSVNDLLKATTEFDSWLQKEVLVEKIWLPSIDLQIDLNIKRIDFIKICGNISKHNFSRLSGVVVSIKKIFSHNNHPLNDEEALLIIGEFYDWFHTDIFSYHSSAIAEFLNNIRWGIYGYLQPEYEQSIVRDPDGVRYKYTYPNGVSNGFAKNCYWELMNTIRSKPYMPKFQITRFLKMRY